MFENFIPRCRPGSSKVHEVKFLLFQRIATKLEIFSFMDLSKVHGIKFLLFPSTKNLTWNIFPGLSKVHTKVRNLKYFHRKSIKFLLVRKREGSQFRIIIFPSISLKIHGNKISKVQKFD